MDELLLWREDIEANLAEAELQLAAADADLIAATEAHLSAVVDHEALSAMLVPLRQPVASALMLRFNDNARSLRHFEGDEVRARNQVEAIREQVVDLKQALRDIGQLIASPDVSAEPDAEKTS